MRLPKTTKALLTQVNLAWWNTSLAPGARLRAEPMRDRGVTSIVDSLLSDGVDVLALGEITARDIDRCGLHRSAKRRWVTPRVQDDRSSALAVSYDERKLTLRGKRQLTERIDGKIVGAGLRLAFEPVNGGALFQLVIVHWPSRITTAAVRERKWIAASLQRMLREKQVPTVLMGDFNDEPFDESMSDHLLAYRDRSLVARRSDALYNPFWRLLGERRHFEEEESSGRLAAGTCFYRSGASTTWHTFDQIVVTRDFVGSGPWTLVESATQIWQREPLVAKDGSMNRYFDHLPVVSSIIHRSARSANG